MNSRSRRGFTLIELIIVVVILGVLASVGLSRITVQIDKVRAAEAFNFGGAFLKAFDRCVYDLTAGIYTPGIIEGDQCNSWAELSITDPALNANNRFTYAFSNSGTQYRVVATSKIPSEGTITIGVWIDTGRTLKTCTSKFVNMCK